MGHQTKRSIEMSRLRALGPTELEPQAKKLLDGVQRKMGMTPNIMRTMAHSPAVLESYLGFRDALGSGVLSPKLREQIAMTVGEMNGCQYCLSAHTVLAKMVGLSDEEIADSRRGRSPDRKTEEVLRFARKVVAERGWVSDDDMAAIRGVGASDAEIAEIVAHVAVNIFSNYFNHVAETEIDFPRVDSPGKVSAGSCG
jgi:uncharacterized peroxidase-related enzyme